jgi:hypothetical protein
LAFRKRLGIPWLADWLLFPQKDLFFSPMELLLRNLFFKICKIEFYK